MGSLRMNHSNHSNLHLEKSSDGIDPAMLPKDNIQIAVLWRTLGH